MLFSEKERITLRLDGGVLDFFRAGGSGYQSRITKAFREQEAARRYKKSQED